jgi:hypothetical protein
MKKRIVWLLTLVVLVGVVFSGCRKKDIIVPERNLEIGFLAGTENSMVAAMSLQTAQASEVIGMLREKVYNGIVIGKQGWRPAHAIATYEEDGKKYRYSHEPLEWAVVEGDPDLVVLEPMQSAGECFVYAAGGKLGKVTIMATTPSGHTDTGIAYIVPDMLGDRSAPVGLVCDEERWMANPDSPGYGAIVSVLSSEADIKFEKETIKFPYGATPLLGVDFGSWLFFDEIDWSVAVENEPAEYPYQYSLWYLMYDKNGRKIAINFQNSAKKPLHYIAWHAQDRE